MKLYFNRAIIGAVLALSVAAVAAQAQPAQPNSGYGYPMGPWMMGQGGMMGGYPMGPWMMGQGGMMGSNGWSAANVQRMCGMMSYQMSGRLAYLKTELRLTKAQEPLWTGYADAVQSSSQSMVTRCNTMMGGNAGNTTSLPDRLALHEQFMAAQVDLLKAVDKNLRPLYAALDNSQKKVADQLIWCPMGMM